MTLVSGAGLTVELAQTGTPASLEPAVELTAYRVVQEALTNALRHAAPATVRVTLTWADGELALDVIDTGATPRADASSVPGGRGLLGLHERVTAHGGTLRSGLMADGGHRVAARLPVRLA